MRAKLFSLIILVVFTLLIFAIVPSTVHADSAEPYHKTVNPAFVPVRIVITFAYTTNFTLPTVSTTNASEWLVTNVTNTGLTFSTGYVDVFNFGFTAYYPTSVTQTVAVDIFTGNENYESIDLVPVSGDSFSMTFTVPTSQEAHFPTSDEILNLWTGKFPTASQFNQWTQLENNAINQQNAWINNNQLWQYVFLGFISVVLLVVVIRVFNRKPEER